MFIEPPLKYFHNGPNSERLAPSHFVIRTKTPFGPFCWFLTSSCEVSSDVHGFSLEPARARAHPRDSHRPELCQFPPERRGRLPRLARGQSLRRVEHGCEKQSC